MTPFEEAVDKILSTSQPTVKLTVKDIGYFDSIATADDLIYNDVFEFKDRLEICV